MAELPERPVYYGMTTNERLFAAGVMGNFDAAALDRDLERMVQILRQTELPESEARRIAEAILANPNRYGY